VSVRSRRNRFSLPLLRFILPLKIPFLPVRTGPPRLFFLSSLTPPCCPSFSCSLCFSFVARAPRSRSLRHQVGFAACSLTRSLVCRVDFRWRPVFSVCFIFPLVVFPCCSHFRSELVLPAECRRPYPKLGIFLRCSGLARSILSFPIFYRRHSLILVVLRS
jgi:hypothetical protein